MAASAWALYNEARRFLMDGTIQLSTTNIDLHLGVTAGSADITNEALTTLGSVMSAGNEVASGNGYTQSGLLITDTWATGDSAGQMRWDMSDVIITATTGSIPNIRYAVLIARTQDSGKNTANVPIAYAALTTIQFTLNTGSTLTIATPAGDGIFELSGG